MLRRNSSDGQPSHTEKKAFDFEKYSSICSVYQFWLVIRRTSVGNNRVVCTKKKRKIEKEERLRQTEIDREREKGTKNMTKNTNTFFLILNQAMN